MAVLEDLASSIYSALRRDLPLIDYRVEDWDAWKRLSKAEQAARKAKIRQGHRAMMPMKMAQREPRMSDIKVSMFMQTWPTSALGFTFKEEPEPTDAYTVVVESDDVCAVYFSGRLAYLVPTKANDMPRQDVFWRRFRSDIGRQVLCTCDEAAHAYKARSINRYGSSSPNGQPSNRTLDESQD